MSAPSPVRRFSIRTRTRSAHWAECSGRGGTMPATLPRCAHLPGSAWGRDAGAAALPVWVRFRPVASAIPASPVPDVRARCAATPSSTGHIPRRSASDCRGYNTRNWPSRSGGASPQRGQRAALPRFSHPPLPAPDSSQVVLYGVIHPYENAPEKIFILLSYVFYSSLPVMATVYSGFFLRCSSQIFSLVYICQRPRREAGSPITRCWLADRQEVALLYTFVTRIV